MLLLILRKDVFTHFLCRYLANVASLGILEHVTHAATHIAGCTGREGVCSTSNIERGR